MTEALPTLVDVHAWDITAHASSPMTHLCPYRDEVDHGTITIQWRVDHSTVELHSLREYLRSYASVKVDHETLTRDVYDELTELGLLDVEVTTTWLTAGMEVTCSTSPTLAGTP